MEKKGEQQIKQRGWLENEEISEQFQRQPLNTGNLHVELIALNELQVTEWAEWGGPARDGGKMENKGTGSEG